MALFTTSCISGSTSTSTSAPLATSPSLTTGSQTTESETIEHRIGVHVIDGAGEFFDRSTGVRFVPRGINLIRLSSNGHTTLDPDRYDPERIEQTFVTLAANGYNVVRIFLNHKQGGLPGEASPLSGEYLDNAADLLQKAKLHGLQVMFTQDWLPDGEAWSFTSDPQIEHINSLYLSKGGLEANQRFFREWASGLIARAAPLDALLAYELRNELHFSDIDPPFSLSTARSKL